MTEIYLVRHCQCKANIHNCIAGVVDYPITERGQGQLDGLAKRFADVSLDAVYTSPLSRTRATAEAIARYNGAPVFEDARFIEFNFGALDGVQMPQQTGLFKTLWYEQPHLFYAPDGDRMEEFGERVWQSLLALAQENQGKRIAVATHGNVLRAICLRLYGWPPERLIDVPWSGNTAVHLVRFDENQKWEYLLKNDASHVPDEFAGPLERAKQ